MLLFILLLVTPSTKQLKLEDVTNEIGLNDLSGDLALGAIADLNSDRYNDLLLVNRSCMCSCMFHCYDTITFNIHHYEYHNEFV